MPHVMFDIEHGAESSTRGSLEFFRRHKSEFDRFVEAWVFAPFGTDDPALLGFYRSREHPLRNLPPEATMPGLVLIDESGRQLWLRNTATSGGEGSSGALTVLQDAGFDTSGGLHRHYLNGSPAPYPFAGNQTIRGELAVYNDRIVKLVRPSLEHSDTAAARLWDWWCVATASGGWLGQPESLTLYGDAGISVAHGHSGFHLVSRGSSNREAWFLLPERPDHDLWQTMDRMDREIYAWPDPVLEQIFASVGQDVSIQDSRGSLRKFLWPSKPRPEIISWSGASS